MNQHRISRVWLVLTAIAVIGLLAAACDMPGSTTGSTTKPAVVIAAPASGSQVAVGQPVSIQVTAADAGGVTRIEIKIDGALVGTAQSQTPQGESNLVATLDWTFAQVSSHAIAAQAFNAAGQASDAAVVTVQAVASVAEQPTATIPPAVQPTNTIPPMPTTAPTEIPDKPVIQSFTANPASITAGQSTTLQWETSGASQVGIEPGVGQMNPSGSKQVSPGSTTTYVLTAWNPGGSVTKEVTVQVNQPQAKPVIQSFTANPASITAGGSTTLQWETSGASQVGIEPGVGQVNPSGSKQVSPAASTTYKLTAWNPGGSVTKEVTVQVNQPQAKPVIQSFTANPASITAGGSTTLQWETSGASQVGIEPGVGQVNPSGSKQVSPGTTTTYQITAWNPGGSVTKKVTVQVNTVPVGNWPTHRQGDQGAAVYAIQYLLRTWGHSLTANGEFGPQTSSAVKSFQQSKGLTVDGIVGSQTWTALIQGRTVKSGSNGDAVRAVQYVLRNARGYNSLAVDGIFGTQTQAAVKSFQQSRGLTVDGIVGPQTWKALVSGL